MKLSTALIIFYFMFLNSYSYANTATNLTDTCVEGAGNYAKACHKIASKLGYLMTSFGNQVNSCLSVVSQ